MKLRVALLWILGALAWAAGGFEVKPAATASLEIREENGTTVTRVEFPEARARGAASPEATLAAVKKLVEKAVSLGLVKADTLNTTVRLEPAEPGIELSPREVPLAALDTVEVHVAAGHGSLVELAAATAALAAAAALIAAKAARRRG